jgi:uncharacterized membrane protein
MSGLESAVQAVVGALALAIESLGALVIGGGVVATAYHWARARVTGTRRVGDGTRDLRLELSRYLALALELQLASDILSTIIAPSWEDLGQLAAVAAIRTFLNVFLAREMRELHGEERATAHA